MVITPGIKDLPYTYDEGIKYFTLIAEEIVWELVDGIFKYLDPLMSEKLKEISSVYKDFFVEPQE